MSLKDKAMLVTLNISVWSARKYDAKASKEVEENHNATDAGRFNKLLLERDSVLKEITKVQGAMRTFHYENTLPWKDNGPRLLPGTNMFNYVETMDNLISMFFTLVNKFKAVYPSLKEEARDRLKTLYNEADYPPVEKIGHKFSASYDYDAIGDATDFRVKCSEEQEDAIKKNIEQKLNERIDNAIADMMKRIKDAVEHMANVLTDPEKKFKNSLVGNICELHTLIPMLNFNNDPKVAEAAKIIKPLCVDDIDALRTNPNFRREIALRAKKILGMI